MSQAELGYRSPTASSIRALSSASVAEKLAPASGSGTIRSALVSNAVTCPDAPAFVFRTADEWTTWTWGDTARIATAIGRSLRHGFALGVGDSILLDAPNGPAWLAIDLGAQMVGAFTIPIYASSPPSSAVLAIAAIGEVAQPKLFSTHRPEVAKSSNSKAQIIPATVEFLLDLIKQAEDGEAPEIEGADIACGIYVRPRATHDNGGQVLAISQRHLSEQCLALMDAFEYRGLTEYSGEGRNVDRRLSVMPWAHIIERIQSVYLGIVAGISTYVPCDHRDILLELRDAQPTLFSASSHLYGHLRQRLIDTIGARYGDVIDLSQAFSDLETESALTLLDQEVPSDLAGRNQQWKEDLVPVVQGLVGARIRLLTSASRLFDADIVLFYEAVGLRIYRSYGGNSLGGLITTNCPRSWKFDTFGTAISPYTISADQHLTVEGPLLWPLSGGEHEAEFIGAIDTADIAEVDEKGWLRIFGADEAVTAERISFRGINLVPTKEESYLMNDPLVDQAVSVEGSMLIVADRDALKDWVRRWGVVAESFEQDPDVIERFQVLTGLTVALRLNRTELRDGAPTSSFWSHVDEIDETISILNGMVEPTSGFRTTEREGTDLSGVGVSTISVRADQVEPANFEPVVPAEPVQPADVPPSEESGDASATVVKQEKDGMVRSQPAPELDAKRKARAQRRVQGKRDRQGELAEKRARKEDRRVHREKDRARRRTEKEDRRVHREKDRARERTEKKRDPRRPWWRRGGPEGDEGSGEDQTHPVPR